MSESLPFSVQMHMEQVCTRFEQAWQAAGLNGIPRRIEDYRGDGPERERSALLRELLRLDLHYRRQRGDNPTAADYEARFPGDAAVIRGVFEMRAASPSGSSAESGVPT